MKRITNTTTTQKIYQFVNQRPGLKFVDYGDIRAYRREYAEITKDRLDFLELMGLAVELVPDLEKKLTEWLQRTSGRLTINESGELEYCTGQYFPTEYRPAACRVLVSVIWNSVRDKFETGTEIRKYLGSKVSRRVKRNYFR